ncbi:16S rRNA m(7)G-527 methyltransferase [Sanguibacter gelidistatuariae]|uniref:Ribosomal RNA small subunit methyltransferase G n=1 Tax=Sanguibacter gelidistatuariae TaxID=1814289 RepID=A0A1G6H3I7_9MICO|nr:16S rRNA (guanine(527)-N(7))-methyltransferase RsmG [Sanguibacter gelidistatuariae]SDB88867.1 16S rRNA m(7)G-527 methyltransferase [Sanguibacter gelidistatuariae]
MDEALDQDALRAYFGDAYPQVSQFAAELASQGEVRGMIGPREIDKIWERHILNSAAIVQFLPAQGTFVDIGSGAGLPGLVIAAMRPAASLVLIEPMERRCIWLVEMVETLGLTNVEVKRGRAEEFHDAFEADVVTSRAVAALEKLARWSLPLLAPGGELVILKGRSVAAEIEPARKVLKKFKMSEPEILEAATLPGLESTTVLRSRRKG